MKRLVRAVAIVTAVALLAACAHSPRSVERSPSPDAPYGGASGAYAQYGRIHAIERIEARGGSTSGAGAILGGLLGIIVGRNMANSGDGKATGTVIGAMGGAILGNEIERDQQRGGGRDVLRVSVELDRGGMRRIEVRDAGDLRVGDRVRVEGDRIFRL